MESGHSSIRRMGQRVEAAVVDAEAESAIVLLGEEHACAERGKG